MALSPPHAAVRPGCRHSRTSGTRRRAQSPDACYSRSTPDPLLLSGQRFVIRTQNVIGVTKLPDIMDRNVSGRKGCTFPVRVKRGLLRFAPFLVQLLQPAPAELGLAGERCGFEPRQTLL